METFKRFMRRGDVRSICGLLLLSGLIALGVANDFDRNHWAAWVQAVGSVIAIAAAIWISSDQWRKQAMLEKTRSAQETVRLARYAESVIERALDVAIEIRRTQHKWPSTTIYFFHESAQIKAAETMLQALMVHPLPRDVANATIRAFGFISKVEADANNLMLKSDFLANSRFGLQWANLDKELSEIKADITKAVQAAIDDPDIRFR